MKTVSEKTRLAFVVLAALLAGCVSMEQDGRREGFVALAEAVPDAILEIRYYSTYNFVGERIDGRGSTVDLTLFDMRTGKEVDMGGTIFL